MPFHPTGPSTRVAMASSTPAKVVLSGLPTTGKVLRLMATSYPSVATCLVAFGTDTVSVTSSNGMPLDMGGKEQFVSLKDETHMSIMMANNANYEIVVTPGEIV